MKIQRIEKMFRTPVLGKKCSKDHASKNLNTDTINNSEHNNIYPKKLSSEHRMTEILQTFCITH
jgi:hypothetical protein